MPLLVIVVAGRWPKHWRLTCGALKKRAVKLMRENKAVISSIHRSPGVAARGATWITKTSAASRTQWGSRTPWGSITNGGIVEPLWGSMWLMVSFTQGARQSASTLGFGVERRWRSKLAICRSQLQFALEGAVEDGGQQGVELGCRVGLEPLQFVHLRLQAVEVRDDATLFGKRRDRNW